MTRLLSLAVLLALSVSPAPAQSPAPAPALTFAVKPNSLEESPIERQARLLERMRRDEYLFRHICRSCGLTRPDATGPGSFDPMAALGQRRAAPAAATPEAGER
jgi:hypothetical protein